ncbi:hypothetical protein PROFUN_13720 [Planoprotostelium fungivorum]|uniref:Uncharacterized protein n=1 Tax=Planoprotostelium fungivorum TaxID=1890364 RepID=A0A2P6N373_9EUKA|nr:hypothetical protein PROFUN_13720 [Planoprotostelium fungivorum]
MNRFFARGVLPVRPMAPSPIYHAMVPPRQLSIPVALPVLRPVLPTQTESHEIEVQNKKTRRVKKKKARKTGKELRRLDHVTGTSWLMRRQLEEVHARFQFDLQVLNYHIESLITSHALKPRSRVWGVVLRLFSMKEFRPKFRLRDEYIFETAVFWESISEGMNTIIAFTRTLKENTLDESSAERRLHQEQCRYKRLLDKEVESRSNGKGVGRTTPTNATTAPFLSRVDRLQEWIHIIAEVTQHIMAVPSLWTKDVLNIIGRMVFEMQPASLLHLSLVYETLDTNTSHLHLWQSIVAHPERGRYVKTLQISSPSPQHNVTMDIILDCLPTFCNVNCLHLSFEYLREEESQRASRMVQTLASSTSPTRLFINFHRGYLSEYSYSFPFQDTHEDTPHEENPSLDHHCQSVTKLKYLEELRLRLLDHRDRCTYPNDFFNAKWPRLREFHLQDRVCLVQLQRLFSNHSQLETVSFLPDSRRHLIHLGDVLPHLRRLRDENSWLDGDICYALLQPLSNGDRRPLVELLMHQPLPLRLSFESFTTLEILKVPSGFQIDRFPPHLKCIHIDYGDATDAVIVQQALEDCKDLSTLQIYLDLPSLYLDEDATVHDAETTLRLDSGHLLHESLPLQYWFRSKCFLLVEWFRKSPSLDEIVMVEEGQSLRISMSRRDKTLKIKRGTEDEREFKWDITSHPDGDDIIIL